MSASHMNFLYRYCSVNGLGAPNVLPPFALGLGTPLSTGAYGNTIPSLGAFALATTAGLGTTNPAALRSFSNVLLVSNLNEEVNINVCSIVLLTFHFSVSCIIMQ